MRFSNSGLFVLSAIAAIAIAACTAASDVEDLGSPAGAGGSGATASANSIHFDEETTIMLAPGLEHAVKVTVEPRGRHIVTFGLVGDAGDASLDRSEALTDDDGHVSVTLTAPSTPETFSVRASLGGGAEAQRAVSVSADGFGTIVVIPSYAGHREIPGWFASASAGTDCASLMGNPPPDGPLDGLALPEGAPQISSVPAGPPIAVVLRAGHFASGCVNLDMLAPSQHTTVTVSVIDRPLQMDATELTVALGIDDLGPEWPAPAEPAIAGIGKAMVGSAPSDAELLLDEMREVSSDGLAFGAARAAGSWDGAVAGRLGGEHVVRDLVRSWMTTGLGALESEDTLTADLSSIGTASSQAELELTRVAGLDPEAAGFARVNAGLSWTADSADGVHLGGTIYWLPSALITALAVTPALTAHPTAEDVPEALALAIGCDEIGSTLASLGPTAPIAFGQCDSTCAADLCAGAIQSMWQRARDTSAASGSIATIEITAAGDARVDDEARPSSFTGSWVGSMDLGYARPSVSGPANAVTPSPK